MILASSSLPGGHLGRIFGASWAIFGSLETILAVLETSSSCLGSHLGHLGHLGRRGVVLEASWEASLGDLGSGKALTWRFSALTWRVFSGR